jgi:organic radical activating enzyme
MGAFLQCPHHNWVQRMETQKLEHPSYSHVDPSRLNAIGIQLTNKCNLNCRHCGSESSPKGKNGPTIEWLCDLIDAITEKTSIKTLMITGGEPFLRYNDLLTMVEKGANKNLGIEVVTNGYWGKNIDKAKCYVKNLTQAGIAQLTISVDVIHQKSIEEKAIENILGVLLDCKTKVPLRIYTLENEFCNKKFIDNIFSNYSDTIDMHVFSQPLLPVGRALTNKKELCIVGSFLSESDNHPCHLVLFPFIDHNKNWYICSNASTLGAKSLFCLGKLEEAYNLDDFIDRHLRSDLCRFMKNIGPIELIHLLKDYEYKDKKFVSVCDLCLQTFRRKDVADHICNILGSVEVQETLSFIDNELISNA